MRNVPVFPKIKAIYAEATVSTAANVVTVLSTSISGNVRLQCTTGVMYVSTLTTAPSPTNAWALSANDDPIDIEITDFLAYMSTSTAPMRQMMVFE